MDSVISAGVTYILLWIAVRLTGRRALGELSTFEFLLLLIIGGAVQRVLLGPDLSLTNAFIVVATLIALHALVTFAERRPGLAKILRGVPIILIENGRPVASQLRHAGVSEDEVMTTARLHYGIDRIEDIKFAILEAGGSISVIPRERNAQPRVGRPPRAV